ncbi:hypothetical protein [Deinococcus sp. PEB2-63]
MQLPSSMLDTTAQVLSEQPGPPDALGQSTRSWQPTGAPVPAAHFPAGERITRQAQLRGVTVAREAYLQGSVNLNPQANRLLIDGVTYRITLVNEWDGFTVAGLVMEGR